ncbi:MAG TPA: ribose 5-phosphate isomerase B [Candidatus Pelethousia gallinarum]|nr:ribose 5-phosphate isomerase B [Christensenellales bacterium]HIR69413.1 ribose 5-phosphate isomerase B [Candidatus Pelethousia gallinarum]
MKIAIASDHGGYDYKQELIPYIESLGHQVLDLGCHGPASVDYPDYGIPCAQAVARGEADRGVVICGTGIGISISANKVPGIRCALCTDPVMARLTREHNDANMLAMGGRIIGIELAKGIVQAFLSTEFSGGRHKTRIDKIAQYEANR